MNTPRRSSAIWVLIVLAAQVAVAQERAKPFTHSSRSVRTRAFDTEHLRLELTFDWDLQQVRGTATLSLRPFEPLQQIKLDAVEMEIQRVVWVGDDGEKQPFEFETQDDELIITLDRQYAVGEEVPLRIHYRLTRPKRGIHFVVPDEHEPEQARIVWTQNQPDYARRWIPCVDSPIERLTSETLTTVPADFFVLSNGTLRNTRDNGDGTKTWHWVQEQEHSPYLISVVAGRFVPYEQSCDGIPILSYVPPERLSDAERSFGKTPAMMEMFNRKIGYRYPWPKYAQICCDEYGGGMEHTSATTLGLRTLHDERAHLDVSSDNLVAHELAHQWWGDLITCKDWAELWLNESFATYFAVLWTEHDRGRDEATWQLHEEAQTYFREDSDRHRRPIVNYRYNQSFAMFDRHSYQKGGRVLHMLRYVLGDEMFWKALNHYAHKHAFGVVETADLRIAIEESTGKALNWFFDEWLYHGGHPEYEVRYTWDDEEKLARLNVRQTQKVDETTPLFRMPIDVELVTAGGTTKRRITLSKADETFSFSLDERPRYVCFDGQDWVLKKLKFDKSKQQLLAQLGDSDHVMCRVRAVEGLKQFKPDTDAASALIRTAAEDRFWAVRAQAAAALSEFTGDEVRRALLAAAREDEKSRVRRAAIEALADFAHEETTKTLEEIIENDPSYYAVAEALRALAKVDKENAREILVAQLGRSSHNEVILAAAADGLAELKETDALEDLQKMLQPPSRPGRRAAVLRAMAKLSGGTKEVVEAIASQLDDQRGSVRAAAVAALGESGSPAAIDRLLSRRNTEDSTRILAAIDAAVEKLRNATDFDKLRGQVQSLEKTNRELDERVRKLEESKSG